jgi:hypothetical protein
LSPEGTSVWASRDATGKHLVLVVLDFMPDVGLDTRINVASCGATPRGTAYVYVQGATDFAATELRRGDGGAVEAALPPYSVTTLDIRLD